MPNPTNLTKTASSTAAKKPLPDFRPGQIAYIGGGGDSISVGHTTSIQNSYQKYAAAAMHRSWFAAGHPGWRTDQILALYDTDVIAKHANYVIVEGGVNDIQQTIAQATIENNLKAMIAKAAADGSTVVFLPIMPWTNGNATQWSKIDSINTNMKSFMSTWYPKHIVCDLGPVIGQFRSGGATGNYWDLQTAYQSDGLHLSIAGNQAVGNFIATTIQNSL